MNGPCYCALCQAGRGMNVRLAPARPAPNGACYCPECAGAGRPWRADRDHEPVAQGVAIAIGTAGAPKAISDLERLRDKMRALVAPQKLPTARVTPKRCTSCSVEFTTQGICSRCASTLGANRRLRDNGVI